MREFMPRPITWKDRLKHADKIGAKYVAVIGGNELQEGAMNVKCMASSESEKVDFSSAAEYFRKKKGE